MVALLWIDLSAENPVRVGGVGQDHRQQNDGSDQSKGQAAVRRCGFGNR